MSARDPPQQHFELLQKQAVIAFFCDQAQAQTCSDNVSIKAKSLMRPKLLLTHGCNAGSFTSKIIATFLYIATAHPGPSDLINLLHRAVFSISFSHISST